MQAVGRKQDRYLLLQYLHSPRPCGLRGSFAREQDLRDFYRLSLHGVYPGKVAHESFLKAGVFAKSSKASHSCAWSNFSARGSQQYRLYTEVQRLSPTERGTSNRGGACQDSTGLMFFNSSSVRSRDTAMNLKPSGISSEKLAPLPLETSTVMCMFL